MKHIVIVGATSAIATACARRWLDGPTVMVTLIGRNIDKLSRLKQDLSARYSGHEIDVRTVDFFNPEHIHALIEALYLKNPFDLVLIAQGLLPEHAQSATRLSCLDEVLQVNAVSPVLFAEGFVSYMIRENQGHLVLIGSVAGDRGRQSNYWYGAAKGLLARYMQGLQHRLAKTSVHAMLVQPGPIDTPMTSHLKSKGVRLASADQVAKDIDRALLRRQSLLYTPNHWRWIMAVIRIIPRRLFHCTAL